MVTSQEDKSLVEERSGAFDEFLKIAVGSEFVAAEAGDEGATVAVD